MKIKIRKILDKFLKIEYEVSDQSLCLLRNYKDCIICGNPLEKNHRNKMLDDLAEDIYKELFS